MTGRLSLNQITIEQAGFAEAVALTAAHGIGSIGLWRHKVDEVGTVEAAARVADAGLTVSSLCRGGMFPAATTAARQQQFDDNLHALEEAVTLGTHTLVLVCGPAAGQSLPTARAQVRDAVERLEPHAAAAGIRLGIEPLHPMMVTSRSVICTLGEALEIALGIDSPHVGVVVDAYHVWWDPHLAQRLEEAAGRIVGYHVSDWLADTQDLLLDRGLMGEGVIDLATLTAQVTSSYDGPIEVEVLSRRQWARPPEEVVADAAHAYADTVVPSIAAEIETAQRRTEGAKT